MILHVEHMYLTNKNVDVVGRNSNIESSTNENGDLTLFKNAGSPKNCHFHQ